MRPSWWLTWSRRRTDEALLAATAKADRLLNEIEEMVAMNCTAVDIAYSPNDLYRLKREGKKAIMLGIENGYAIGKDTFPETGCSVYDALPQWEQRHLWFCTLQ